jgi:hypothetical protein
MAKREADFGFPTLHEQQIIPYGLLWNAWLRMFSHGCWLMTNPRCNLKRSD